MVAFDRHLDISHDNISLDITRQKDIFLAIMKNLRELRLLSVAYNCIQDNGFEMITNLAISHWKSLKVLDVAKCYITSKSISLIQKLIDTKEPKLQELMLQSNMLTTDQTRKLRYPKYSMARSMAPTIMEEVTLMFGPIRVMLDGAYFGIDMTLSRMPNEHTTTKRSQYKYYNYYHSGSSFIFEYLSL